MGEISASTDRKGAHRTGLLLRVRGRIVPSLLGRSRKTSADSCELLLRRSSLSFVAQMGSSP